MTNQLQSALLLGLALGLAADASRAQLASQRIAPFEPGGGFGTALDMADGHAAVAAPTATVDGFAFAGRVDIFERADSAIVSEAEGEDGIGVVAEAGIAQLVEASEDRNGSWILRATLTAPPEELDFFDQFGSAVSIDANRVAIGASKDEGEGGTNDAGAVYVFRMTTAGDWIFEQKLTAPDGSSSDRFGAAVSLSGRELICGAPGNDAVGFASGAAYVYRRTPGDGWNFETKLVPAELAAGDTFGFAVAVESGRLLVGAAETQIEATAHAGVVYPFVYEEKAGEWVAEERLVSPNPTEPGQFGFSVALDADQAIIGAPSGDGGGGSSGLAYSFTRTDRWELDQSLSSPQSVPSARFAESVAIDGDTVAIGASLQDSEFQNATGMVHVFRRVGSIWAERGRLAPCYLEPGTGLGADVAIEGKRILASALNDLPEPTVHGFRVTPLGLSSSPCPISIELGGRQEFAIHAGSGQAGRLYALLGTITGTAPGFDFDFAHIPLSVDPYFAFTLAATSESLVGFAGTLNEVGTSFATLDLPGGLGFTMNTPMHHAFVIVDPVSQFVVQASEPVRTALAETVVIE